MINARKFGRVPLRSYAEKMQGTLTLHLSQRLPKGSQRWINASDIKGGVIYG